MPYLVSKFPGWLQNESSRPLIGAMPFEPLKKRDEESGSLARPSSGHGNNILAAANNWDSLQRTTDDGDRKICV